MPYASSQCFDSGPIRGSSVQVFTKTFYGVHIILFQLRPCLATCFLIIIVSDYLIWYLTLMSQSSIFKSTKYRIRYDGWIQSNGHRPFFIRKKALHDISSQSTKYKKGKNRTSIERNSHYLFNNRSAIFLTQIQHQMDQQNPYLDISF